MKAQDIMTTEHLWVSQDDSNLCKVAQIMSDHNVGSVPVVDAEGKLVGIVTDRDVCCRGVAQERSPTTPVREIMSESLHFVNEDAGLNEIEDIMRRYRIRRLPIVDANRKLLGIISLGDLAKHVHGLLKEHRLAETLEAVSSTS